MKKNGEVTMEEAIDLIVAYFEGDFDLITLFTEVASEMVEATEGARIRYNERIIGVAVPDERYRFYILKQDGAYTVKYKHHSEALPFVQQDKERYYSCNMECRAFFDAHPEMRVYASAPTDESYGSGKKPKRKRAALIYDKTIVDKDEAKKQWASVLTHSERSLDAEKIEVGSEILQAYFQEIRQLLLDFSRAVLPERERDIIINRILNPSSVTLQAIGEHYGISRERVRQLEVRQWRMLTNGLHRSSRALYSTWRQRLCDILLSIDVTHYIQAIAYFLEENTSIGELIVQASTPPHRSDAYHTAISQSMKSKLTLKQGERIPEQIIKQVQGIEIVPFIQGIQELALQGENYNGVCRKCSANTLVVYPKNNSFYCFSCQAGGNIITYCMQYENIDYRTAVMKLAHTYHIGETNSFLPRNLVMREAALYFHEQLRHNPNNKAAIDVIHSWGIAGTTVVRLGLGYNDSSHKSALKFLTGEKKIPLQSLQRDQIVTITETGYCQDRMRNSVIIPTVDTDGNVICFDFYIIHKGSFVFYPPSQGFFRKENLYSLNLAVRSAKNSVIVVSDYRAYFALAGIGIFNAVSTYLPQISEAQLKKLKKYFKVIILATIAVADFSNCREFCRENDMYCERLSIEGDVAEYIFQNRESIQARIDYYESVFATPQEDAQLRL